MALTLAEETTLRALIKQVKDTPVLTDVVKVAEAALAEVMARYYAARDVEQLRTNEAMAAINIAYQTEIAQATAAVEAAKQALEDSKVLTGAIEVK